MRSEGVESEVESASASLGLSAVPRSSLIQRTLLIVENKLRAGLWEGYLPSERKLAEALQVSRMTLRQALSELERRGWISAGRGRRRQILQKPAACARSHNPVVLLSPVALKAMDPQMVLLLHHLMESLQKQGLHLEIEVRPSCFTRRPERALSLLSEELQPAVWILFRGNQPAQEWFRRSGLPFVIVGSCFVPDALSFGSHHFAIGAHAAAQFQRLGHEHSVIIGPRHATPAISNESLVQGFKQGGLSCRVIEHDRTREGILRSLDHALCLLPKITGIFSIGGEYSVTLLTALLSRGVAVPKEVSLIAMGESPVFQYLVPKPAYYAFSMEKAARLLHRLICCVVLEGRRGQSSVEIIPNFVAGESLAAAGNVETQR